MVISDRGISLIKMFEGCRLDAYQDYGGIWTIGYGWTQSVDGVPVGRGMRIDRDKAEELLRGGLVNYEREVTRLVTVSINQNQFDALTSFSYNVGIDAFRKSTLLEKLNAGDYWGAAEQFLNWNKVKGVPLPGLTRRRKAESELFQS
ncbi:lysozyme [Erwinia sp. HR93]|uniref:lysozyme n=1 Tax=Erwinia sp. HR93 TaxID=3094840 RepID=UPI002ADEC26A|nr:lysozyme [Erwinia sp. HR93]MEA1062359.1 lysozyme [Erwinia sp. HR93]